jgi:uncharacterized membrane protein YhaH (DUF805 family)
MIRRLWAGYREGLIRYADFSGRSGWGDYFAFFLINFGISALLAGGAHLFSGGIFATLGLLYGLFALLPGVAVTVRLIRGIIVGKEID